MAFKFVSLLATLAVVNAGYIETYSDDHHQGYIAQAPAKIAYSSAPAVSHVYSTLSSQLAPVQKTVAYAAPVQKTVTYAAPVHKTYDDVGHGLSTYYSPANVLQKSVYADGHDSHYSSENHYHSSSPSHTLAYAPVAKEISYAPIAKEYSYAPVAKAVSYAPVAKSITYAPTVYESHEPTYGHTHESVHRSHDGTVSHYGKTISGPHSHVHKSDTRINNEHYNVAAVPTYTYQAAPLVSKITTSPVYQQYAHSAPVVQKYVAPAVVQKYVAPAIQSVAAVPAVKYTSVAPAVHQYTHSAPAVHQYDYSAPAVHQYAHSAPVVAQKTYSYSPAEAVAHATFQSTDAHYSW